MAQSSQQFGYEIIPKIGDVVLLQQTIATVMYIGPVHWNSNKNLLHVGLELLDQIQNGHNGTYDNMIYFKCKLKHGIILPLTTIIKIISPKELLNKLSAFKAKVHILNNETQKLKQDICKLSQINNDIIADDEDTKHAEIITNENKISDVYAIYDYDTLKNEFNEIKKQKNEISNKLDAMKEKTESMEQSKTNEINKLTETLNITQNEMKTQTQKIKQLIQQKNVLISENNNFENSQKQLINQHKSDKNELLQISETQENEIQVRKQLNDELKNDINLLTMQKNKLISENSNFENSQKQLINKHKSDKNELLQINKTQENEIRVRKQLNIELRNEINLLTTQKNELIETVKEYQAKNKEENQEIYEIKQGEHTENIHKHSKEFWNDIESKLKSDSQAIKALIGDGILTMFDANQSGNTLLHLAAYYDNTEITQLCLNLSANMTLKNNIRGGETALDIAKYGKAYSTQEILLMNGMNANIAKKTKAIAKGINKQNGFIENITDELLKIGVQTYELFSNTMTEIMINILNKKLSFSDDLLLLCWELQKNPIQSELWYTVETISKEIVHSNDERDWFWFENCLLASRIWYKEMNEMEEKSEGKRNKKYLYDKLLSMVEKNEGMQLKNLSQNMGLEKSYNSKKKKDWKELIEFCFDIENENKNKPNNIRQDMVENAIVVEYTKKELIVNHLFNGSVFYDHFQYLSKLLLLAHSVDESFQTAVGDLFNVNKYTNIGSIDDDNKEEIIVNYKRAAVKLSERARITAENNYFDEIYPSSACVVDLNRCSLIFANFHDLLVGLKLFVKKVQLYESGSIIGIVAIENGFQKYSKNVQYADIKINVLIRGDSNNIIGEIQFLLQTMVDYQNERHNIEFVNIFPLLLNENKRLSICASDGSLSQLFELMVFSNKSKKDILYKEKECILIPLAKNGNLNIFKYAMSLLEEEAKINLLFTEDEYAMTPIERAVRNSNLSLITYIVTNVRGIKEKYKENEKWQYRLVYRLFISCPNVEIIEQVLVLLDINNDTLKRLLLFKYPKKASYYYKDKILVHVVLHNNVNVLQRICDMLGVEMFVEMVMESDLKNKNALEKAIGNNKLEIIQYLMCFKEIKMKCTENDDVIYRIVYHLFVYGNEDIINVVLHELQIEDGAVIKAMSYKYAKPTQQFAQSAYQYDQWNIIGRVIFENTLDILKKLTSIIGQQVFMDNVLVSNGNNINGLEYAIRKNKLSVIKYLMSFEQIVIKCVSDREMVWRIIYWINKQYNEAMAKHILNVLQLNEEDLKGIQAYKCKKPDIKYYFTYWDKKISDDVIKKLLNAATE